MKFFSKSIFNIFSLLTLLAMFIGLLPASPVKASPLFISGDFLWAKSMGASTAEEAYEITVDSSGNVYTTGYFQSTIDFDPNAGVFELTSLGKDIFVSKLDRNGNFVWAKRMGGASEDVGNSITVDSNGNIYVTGYFEGADAVFGTTNLASDGGFDIFVTKLDSNGNFIWAKRMGGISEDKGHHIIVDSSGNVYSTGYFSGTADFDPSDLTSNLTSAGAFDGFVSKLDSNGDFVWSKRMGGANQDEGTSITLDSNNDAYTTGYFGAGDADFGATNLTSAGLEDIFVSKLDSSGNFVWAKKMGGTSADKSFSITIDSNSDVLTTGTFQSTDADFDPGASTSILAQVAGGDAFVSKLDSNGNFVWAKRMGGVNEEVGYSIGVDSSNNIYTTGSFYTFSLATADFGVNPPLSSAGDNDIFVAKLDSNGTTLWAKSMGGSYSDIGYGIDLGINGNIYITGYFSSPDIDFDPGAGTFNLPLIGNTDIFISKLENDTLAPTVTSIVRANPNPTNLTSVNFTVTFSESVTGVDITNFNLTTSGVSGAAVSGFSGSGSSYTATVSTGTGNGTIRLNVSSNNSIKDAATNPMVANFNSGEVYSVSKTATFADVPLDYWANNYIERLYYAGVTGGCSTVPLNYCPENTVTRAQMAIFLLKAKYGSSYTPPAVGIGSGFDDVPLGSFAEAWIKQLAAESITSGCGNGNYCPDATVTRASMAIFLLKSKHGSAFNPPTAIGVFADVPVGTFADKWIEKLASEGITGGCSTVPLNYCPDDSVNRAQMAIFLVKTFNLP